MTCPQFRINDYKLCEDHRQAAALSDSKRRTYARREMCLQDSARKGAAAELATPEMLAEYLSNPILLVSQKPEYVQSCHNIVEDDPLLPTLYVDTEFGGSLMCEVAILNSRGETVLSGVVDWENDYLALLNNLSPISIVDIVLERFYGPSAAAKPDMTVLQLCIRLEQLGFPNVQLIG